MTEATLLSQVFERYKNSFLTNPLLRLEEVPVLANINATENPYLYPFYLQLTKLIERYSSGVFILDTRAIWTPIEIGSFGVLHCQRLPQTPAVYGITDLTDCAVLYLQSKVIFFQGVILMERFGYKFKNEEFQIKPIPGLSFASPRIMITMDEAVAKRELNNEEEEEEEIVS